MAIIIILYNIIATTLYIYFGLINVLRFCILVLQDVLKLKKLANVSTIRGYTVREVDLMLALQCETHDHDQYNTPGCHCCEGYCLCISMYCEHVLLIDDHAC